MTCNIPTRSPGPRRPNADRVCPAGLLRRLVRLWVGLGACGILAASFPADGAAGSAADEYEVKSAYLLNFARFVAWPPAAFESDSSEIRIGIVGSGPLDRGVELGMERRAVHGHPVRIVRVEDPATVTSCHLVFVPHTAAASTDKILSAAAGAPVLTVGESASFAAHGGVIQFYVEQQVVRFEINPLAAESGGLTISSRLLSLACLTPAGSGPARAAP